MVSVAVLDDFVVFFYFPIGFFVMTVFVVDFVLEYCLDVSPLNGEHCHFSLSPPPCSIWVVKIVLCDALCLGGPSRSEDKHVSVLHLRRLRR